MIYICTYRKGITEEILYTVCVRLSQLNKSKEGKRLESRNFSSRDILPAVVDRELTSERRETNKTNKKKTIIELCVTNGSTFRFLEIREFRKRSRRDRASKSDIGVKSDVSSNLVST